MKKEVAKLVTSFKDKGEEFKSVLKMGRTQLQDAVPMSLGQEFSAWGTTINEEVKVFELVKSFIKEVNLGATAIGTGVNSPAEYSELAVKYLSEIVGDQFVQAEDLVEATNDTGAYVMLSGALKRCSVKLSKICNDLRILSSGPRCGINEINLPEVQAGSSIMPAKVNSVIPEVVNQVCFKIIGNDVTISFASEAGQLQLNVMEPVIAQSLFESMELLINAMRTLREKCIDGITANEKLSYDYVMNSIGIVTYLNPFIGHHNGDIVGKRANEEGKTVREVVLEMGLMDEAKLDEILSPENLINPKYMGKKF